jgi:hypothetical protein
LRFPETSQNLSSFKKLLFSSFHRGTKGFFFKTGESPPLSIFVFPIWYPLFEFDIGISKNSLFSFFQVEQDLSIGISAVSASGDASDGPEVPLANGEKSKKEKASSKKEEAVTPKKKQADEDKKLGVTRVYSSLDASGKLYLKRIQTVAESKKQSKIIKYPLVRITESYIFH